MIYELPRLIIGNSIEALLYAWRTQTKIVVKDPCYVFRHDRKLRNYDFSFVNAENPKQFYNNLTFSLSLTSLLLWPDKISTVRELDGLVTIVTSGNRKILIKVEEVIYFDEETKLFNVYDFFDTREMVFTEETEILDEETDFVRQVNLYSSPRTDNSVTKDVVTSSIMSRKELLSPDYGQGIVMLKTLRMFKSAGINGKFAWERKGKKYYKRPKIEFYRRVTSMILNTKYSFDEIYKMEQEEGEAWKMLEKLRKREGTSLE